MAEEHTREPDEAAIEGAAIQSCKWMNSRCACENAGGIPEFERALLCQIRMDAARAALAAIGPVPQDTPSPLFADDQCPSCHFHPGHDPKKWFDEEAKIRGYVTAATAAPKSGEG